jgi:beta-lactam-binding protein with PASTA domain
MAKHLARLGTVVALFGLVLALTGANYPIPGCKVPNVQGKALASAETAIIQANCAIGKISTAKSSSIPIGDVISSSPVAGTSHQAGKSVDLKVSIGNPKPPVPGKKCKVPDVVKDTLGVAAKAIEKANCTVGKITSAKSKKIKTGHVISSSPTAGTKEASGAKVDLQVSKGNGKKKKKKK